VRGADRLLPREDRIASPPGFPVNWGFGVWARVAGAGWRDWAGWRDLRVRTRLEGRRF
jgi:hypothetical protein